MTMPHDARPDESHDEPSVELMDTLKRLAARLAFMERAGIFGFGQPSAGLGGGNASLKNACRPADQQESTDASQCPPDLTNSRILNHALKLESLEPECNARISVGQTVPAIRVTIGSTEFGVSSPAGGRLQCRVTLHIEHNSHKLPRRSPLTSSVDMAPRASRKLLRVSHRPRISSSQPHAKRRPSKLPVLHHPRSSPEGSCRHPRRRHPHPPGNGCRD